MPAAAAGAAPGRTTVYPVAVRGELDPGVGRWLWLVKWLLLIPHYIVLLVLWFVFWVLTVVAFFAILFTGRYPRGIFDFNLGVLRWTWRVLFYSYWALGTDRYPPFSLGEEPDYPATLHIDYPERLSHWLPLVKWLLAIPHLILVALFVGGWGWGWDWGERRHLGAGFAGLVGILVVIAGVVLLFTGISALPLRLRAGPRPLGLAGRRLRGPDAGRVPAVPAGHGPDRAQRPRRAGGVAPAGRVAGSSGGRLGRRLRALDDEHGPAGVAEHAVRDAAEQRGGGTESRPREPTTIGSASFSSASATMDSTVLPEIRSSA